MAVDMPAILDAVAARFDPANVIPPAGYGNIRLSTARLPNQMGPLPCVFVFLVGGSFEALRSQRRDSHHEVVIRFYLGQGMDIPRETAAYNAWAPVLTQQLRLMPMIVAEWGETTRAQITDYSVGKVTYAQQEYSCIELTADLFLNEAWSLT